MRTSPGPGSPTGRSTSFISSGPPAFSMRMVGLVVVVVMAFSQWQVAVRYRARADPHEATHPRPQPGHRHPVGRPADATPASPRPCSACTRAASPASCRPTRRCPRSGSPTTASSSARARCSTSCAIRSHRHWVCRACQRARRRPVRAVLELRRRHAVGVIALSGSRALRSSRPRSRATPAARR